MSIFELFITDFFWGVGGGGTEHSNPVETMGH